MFLRAHQHVIAIYKPLFHVQYLKDGVMWQKTTLVGVCTLRWLISVDVPFLKSPYNSVKMTIYFDIINLVGNYMVVNELEIPYENKPL